MTKNDLIRRADAIKTIHRYKHRLEGRGQTYGFLLEEFENRIPSAQTDGDLISRADAIEALGEEPEIILDTDAEWEMHDRWVDAMTSMKSLPSAEAVQVVRCKDCRYRDLDEEITHFYWCRINERPVDDDDFCAWGERKGGDDK